MKNGTPLPEGEAVIKNGTLLPEGEAVIFSDSKGVMLIMERVGPRAIKVTSFWGEVTFTPGVCGA